MNNDWNARQYLLFEQERTRPAQDLLAQIAGRSARQITDLGCGPGNSTALLRQNWADAQITGIDSSENMLQQARQNLPSCRFVQQDFTRWQPETPQDVLFANASLQWANRHDLLLPKLAGFLAPGGVLAVQMPDNLREPSHTAITQLARQPHWRNTIGQPQSRPPLPDAEAYYDILAGAGCTVRVWRTRYYHVLPDADQIGSWFGSTAIRPYLANLNDTEQARFMQEYREAVRPFYPARADGNILLALPRLFIVAEKQR